MKNKIKLIFIMMLFVLGASASGAEERFGINVYPGAKLEKDTSAWISEAFSTDAFCYVTSDSVEKVVEFYKKEAGMEFMGSTEQGGMFMKGEIQITIQNPWQDMKNGQLMNSTLISIVKPTEDMSTYDEDAEEVE